MWRCGRRIHLGLLRGIAVRACLPAPLSPPSLPAAGRDPQRVSEKLLHVGLVHRLQVNWLMSQLCGLQVNKTGYSFPAFCSRSLTTCFPAASLPPLCSCGTPLFLCEAGTAWGSGKAGTPESWEKAVGKGRSGFRPSSATY